MKKLISVGFSNPILILDLNGLAPSKSTAFPI
jgi:hypothetical protein